MKNRDATRAAVFGTLSSRLGDEMAVLAVLLLAFDARSGDGSDGAVVVGVLSVAAAVGGPVLGVWLDRSRRPAPLAISLAVFAIGLAGSAALLHEENLGAAVAVAFAAGLFAPAVAGGWSATLTSNDPLRARRLVSFDAASYNAAGLAAPVLVGAVFATSGRVAPLVITIALLLVGAGCALSLRTSRDLEDAEHVPSGSVAGYVGDLRAGVTAIVRSAPLASGTAVSCMTFLGVGILVAAAPRIGEDRLGTPAAGAALLAVVAVAALAANVAVARRSHLDRPLLVVAWSTGLIGVGLALLLIDDPLSAAVGAVVIGVGDGPQLAALIALRHRESPARLRTQVFTTGASLKITSSGIGALACAPLLESGLTAPLVVACGACLAATAVAARSATTHRDAPPPP